MHINGFSRAEPVTRLVDLEKTSLVQQTQSFCLEERKQSANPLCCKVALLLESKSSTHSLVYSYFIVVVMSESTELSTLFSSLEEEEEFIAEGDLEELLEDYKPSQLSQYDPKSADSSKLIKNCRPMDILIGRFVSHPGNVLARKVIQTNRDFFRTLDPDRRKEAVDATISFFESKGSRFLEAIGKNNGSFRIASYFNVAEKFRKSLRETGIRADRPPPKKVKKAIKRATNKNSNKKPAPIKVQKKVKSNPPRNVPPPPSTKSRSGIPIVFNPRKVKAGDRLAVYWPEDNVYYPGTVTRISGTEIRFHYDDGERETLDISLHNFVILGKSPRDRQLQSDASKENKVQPTAFASTVTKRLPRRVSMPTKEENSVHTKSSTDSHSSSGQEAEPVPIHVQGTFKQTTVAAVPSLAAFLRGKLNKSSP